MTLKECRLSMNLSQHELAEKSCVTQRMISAIESGDRRPSTELAKKFAEIFDLSIEQIWNMFYK